MKKMSKWISMLACLAMAASMAACGGSSSGEAAAPAPAATEAAAEAGEAAQPQAEGDFAISDSDPEMVITLSHNSGESTVLHETCVFFKEFVEANTKGKVTVDIFPNGTLMDVKQTNEAIKDGSIQMSAGSPSSAISTALGIVEIPNTVNSEAECHEMIQPGTDLRNLLDELMVQSNLRIISLEPCNFRIMTSNKEVRSFDDLKGLNIRVMDNAVPMSFWKEWGANPTPIAWAETYISIQQGLVDAQENPYDSIIAANLFEVQKYLIATNHTMFYTGLYMNNDFYNALPENYKAVIDAAGTASNEYAYNRANETSAEKLALLQEKGMEYIEFTAEDYAKMRAGSTGADALVKESVGEEIFNRAMKAFGY